MDQRVSEYETWADLKHYCVHSADPCGRLVLGVLRKLDEPELVAASDSVCTGLQLVNFLQDVPRDLELGRIYLPADDRRTFGDPPLDRPTRGAARAAAVRGAARCGAPRRGRGAARADRRAARPGSRALLPRWAGRARRARVGRLGHLQRPAAAVACPPRARGRTRPGAMSVAEAYAEVGRITRREAKNFAYGIMVLPREKRQAIAAIYAFAREVDDVADGELPPRRSAPSSRSFARRSMRIPRIPCSSRCATRGSASASRASRSTALDRRRPAGPRAVAPTPTSPSCAATARRSRARSGSRASRSTARDDTEQRDARSASRSS